MTEAFGEHGGVVKKVRAITDGAGGYRPVGTEIPASEALRWPLANRMAMARTGGVAWYQAPATAPAPVAAVPTAAAAIDPDTAPKDELRAWLSRETGRHPAPATAEDTLRALVRERLATRAAAA